MKKTLLFLGLAFYSISLISQSKGKNVEQIPILAWYGVSPKECTVERFLELRQSGITHNFTFFSNVDELETAMKSAQKAGVKMIIHCPELEKEPSKIVSRFKNHPALAGYFLRDEPNKNDFKALGEWARKIQSIDNAHFCYLNLFPNYAPKEALGVETYREYVRQFIEEVPLPILSFDHYPIISDQSGNRFLREEWYENLEIVSDESCKANKPFWAFALTVAHGSYPTPTIEEIRLQVFSNLAYGAQGIQYFTYWTPSINEGFDFHHAPIDFDTKKRTEIYDYITQVNSEIKALSPVFLHSEVISISHTGKSIPKGTFPLTSLPSVIRKLNIEGKGAIVSVLKNKDTSYLIIVNRDLKEKMYVTIDGERTLNRVLKSGMEVQADSYIQTLPVDPGDLLIYSWKL